MRFTIRSLLLLFLSAGWFWSSAARAAEPVAPTKRPNVLFIAVDDLNDWIGCMGGHPDAKTPNLDKLAARGTLFTNAHCAAPACNPSRAALLTGVRPSTSGVYHNDQPWKPVLGHVPTMPKHFMEQGYEVVGGGKIFHGGTDDRSSWHDYFKPGGGNLAEKVIGTPHNRSGGIVWGALDATDEEMPDYKLATWAGEFLGRKHEKPFFLAVGFVKPHMPWQVPQKYYDLYPPDKIAIPKAPADDLEDVPAAGRAIARPQGDHAKMLQTGNWKYAVQGYLASISFIDAQVGRVIEALDASPHKEDTIVVLWGDHGWHLGEKQHWRKFALWEEATKAPLIYVAPGVTKPGTRCDRPIDFMSFYPTLSELCSLPTPKHQEGVSVAPLLKDPRAAWERPALTTHGKGNHAVRSQRYRYIRYADGSEELYDHDADPMEWKNLAADAALAGVKKELAAYLPKADAENAPRRRGADEE